MGGGDEEGKVDMLWAGSVPVLALGAVVLWSVIGCALLFLGWWWFGVSRG